MGDEPPPCRHFPGSYKVLSVRKGGRAPKKAGFSEEGTVGQSVGRTLSGKASKTAERIACASDKRREPIRLHMVDCEGGQFKFATGPVVCHIEPQTGLSRLLVHVGVRDDQARKASWNQRGWS